MIIFHRTFLPAAGNWNVWGRCDLAPYLNCMAQGAPSTDEGVAGHAHVEGCRHFFFYYFTFGQRFHPGIVSNARFFPHIQVVVLIVITARSPPSFSQCLLLLIGFLPAVHFPSHCFVLSQCLLLLALFLVAFQASFSLTSFVHFLNVPTLASLRLTSAGLLYIKFVQFRFR